MNRNKTNLSILGLLSTILLLSACGPSQAEIDATATQTADEIFAKQTAEAPIATEKPILNLANSAEDILGTWSSLSMELTFNENGISLLQIGAGSPRESEFRFEGTRLIMKEVTNLRETCVTDGFEVGFYEVELLENGNLKFIVIEDECTRRVSVLEGGIVKTDWEPVPAAE